MRSTAWGGSELTAVSNHSGDTKFYPTLDISQNVLRHSEVAKPLSTLDIGEDFSRHSERSEESISKSISNIKDSSVTSFPQNDGLGLDMVNDCSSPLPMGEGALVAGEGLSRHSEVTKSLSTLDVGGDISRHKEKNTQYPTCQSCDSHPELDSGSINFNLKTKPTLIDSDFRQNDPKQLLSRKGTGLRLLRKPVKLYARFNTTMCVAPHNVKKNPKAGLLRLTPRNDWNKVVFTLAEVFLPHPTSHRKAAFTLAEVLITLGIIGVVAAMTMPVLIASYQKMVLKQQFKKSYSFLTQSLNQIIADYDASVPECYYIMNSNNEITGNALAGDCKLVRNNLFSSINIIKTCEDKSYEKGCIPKYKGFDNLVVENNPHLSAEDAMSQIGAPPGFYQNAILNTNASYVLADGTIILDYGNGYFPIIFAIDVNGMKGPNKWGYDLFSFRTTSNKNKYILELSLCAIEKGGKSTQEMVDEINK